MGAIETGDDVKQTKPAAYFGKGVYRAFLAATLIALLPAVILPAAAEDEEKPHWFGSAYDNKTLLVYGIPDSDYVMLSFSCAIGKAVVNVNVQDEESTAEEGALMHVRLSSSGETIEFSEKARPNQDSGGADVKGHLPLDDTLRAILTATDTLEIIVDGHTQRYDMDGAAEPVAAMIAACDAPKPASDLDVTLTNKTKRPLQSFVWSKAGANNFEGGDEFDPGPLSSGASWTFTIPDGRKICTYDIAVIFEEEECCSDPLPAGTQNLCENSAFVVHD
jgi:hypothetical protein